MRSVTFLNEYKGKILALRKLIKSWELISTPNDTELDVLCRRILDDLYKEENKKKIAQLVESELIVKYGLYSNAFDTEGFAKQIIDCWKK